MDRVGYRDEFTPHCDYFPELGLDNFQSTQKLRFNETWGKFREIFEEIPETTVRPDIPKFLRPKEDRKNFTLSRRKGKGDKLPDVFGIIDKFELKGGFLVQDYKPSYINFVKDTPAEDKMSDIANMYMKVSENDGSCVVVVMKISSFKEKDKVQDKVERMMTTLAVIYQDMITLEGLITVFFVVSGKIKTEFSDWLLKWKKSNCKDTSGIKLEMFLEEISKVEGCKQMPEKLRFVLSALVFTTPKYSRLFLQTTKQVENNEQLDLSNPDDVIKQMEKNQFYPSFDSELNCIAEFSSLPGVFHDMENVCQGRNEFLGERRDVGLAFVPALKQAGGKGIMLHNFDRKKTAKVFEEKYTHDFQCDWIWVRPEKIVFLEVGITEKAEDPTQTLENKMKQLADSSYLSFRHVIYSIAFQFWTTKGKGLKESAEKAETFVANYIDNVIFIPNADISKFYSKENPNTQTFILNKSPDKSLKNSQEFSNVEKFSVHTVGRKSKNKIEIEEEGSELSEWIKKRNSLNEEQDQNCKLDEKDLEVLKYVCFILSIASLSPKASEESDLAQKVNKGVTEKLRLRNILLTPQQFGILEKSPRFLTLNGEPGTGKTFMLLEIALRESEKPEVEQIYFCLNENNTGLKRHLEKCVDEFKETELKKKLEILPNETHQGSSVFECLQKMRESAKKEKKYQTLNNKILLVDELYLNTIQHQNKPIFSFQELADDFFPHFRKVWICQVMSNQNSIPKIPSSHNDESPPKVAKRAAEKSKMARGSNSGVLEGFVSESMNVLFRSAAVIGGEASRLRNRNQHISRSTAQLTQCLISKNDSDELRILKLEKPEVPPKHPDAKKSEYPGHKASWNQESKYWNLEPISDSAARKGFHIIVFTDDESHQAEWRYQGNKLPTEECSLVLKGDHDLQKMQFGGCEYEEVIVIVYEGGLNGPTELNLSKLCLAMTRAESKLHIWVHPFQWGTFWELWRPPTDFEFEKIMIKARNGEGSLNLKQLNLFKRLKEEGTHEDAKEQLIKLSRVAVITQNERLLHEIAELPFKKDGKQIQQSSQRSIPTQALLSIFHVNIEVTFWEQFKKKSGSRFREPAYQLSENPKTFFLKEEEETLADGVTIRRPRINLTDMVGCAIRRRLVGIVEKFLELMSGNTRKQFIEYSPNILYDACFSGDPDVLTEVIELTKTEENSQNFEDRINKNYERLNSPSDENGQTLLIMVCRNNSDPECARILLESGFKAFEEKSSDGKNCLQYAIWYGNQAMVEVLLKNEDSRHCFLQRQKLEYDGKTAVDYANSLGYEKISNCIKDKEVQEIQDGIAP